MAKIGTAQVEAIHIPDGAVSEYANGSCASDSNHFGTVSQDVTITNTAALPVELWLDGIFSVTSTGASVNGSATVAVKRKNDGVYLFQTSLNHSTGSTYSAPISAQMLDPSAGVGQVYTIEVSASKTGGSGVSGEKASASANLILIAAKK